MKTFTLNKKKTQSFDPKNIKSLTEFNTSTGNKVNGKVLRSIPLNEIGVRPQVRTIMENIDELAESLKSGQLLPISVMKEKNGKYTVLQGERRLLAAREAGLTEIEAIIVDAPKDDVERIYGQLTENIQRENMKLCDLVHSIDSLIQQGKTQTEIAKRLGKDRTYISRIAALADSNSKVLDLINASLINDPQTAQIVNLICEKSHNLEKDLQTCKDTSGHISRAAAQRLLDHLNALENQPKKQKKKIKAFEDRLKKKEIPQGFNKLSASSPIDVSVSFIDENGNIQQGHLLTRLIPTEKDCVCILCEKDHKTVSVKADQVTILGLQPLA